MSPREQAEQMATEIMEELDFTDKEQRLAYVRRFLHELLATRRDALLEAADTLKTERSLLSSEVRNWLRARAAEMTAAVHETGHPHGR